MTQKRAVYTPCFPPYIGHGDPTLVGARHPCRPSTLLMDTADRWW